MGATTPREEDVADSQFGGGPTSFAPGTWYLALSTTTPSNDGSGFTEPVGGSYARVACTNDLSSFTNASQVNGITTKTNAKKFTFPDPTGSWGNVTHFGFFTTSTGGIVQYHNPLDTSISPKAGNTPVEFDIGELVMTFS